MQNNDEFKRRFSERIKRLSNKLDALPGKVALELLASMVLRSPVDTGRFRSNWKVSVGSVDTDASAVPGCEAYGLAVPLLANCLPGQSIFITNSLPYARRLEYGWSQQSPQGMVRLTIVEFPQFIQKALKAIV